MCYLFSNFRIFEFSNFVKFAIGGPSDLFQTVGLGCGAGFIVV